MDVSGELNMGSAGKEEGREGGRGSPFPNTVSVVIAPPAGLPSF